MRWPSLQVEVELGRHARDDFAVDVSATVRVSRLVPRWRIEHGVRIDNVAPR